MGFVPGTIVPQGASEKCLPSETKLLLTKNYSEIIVFKSFQKLRISRTIPRESVCFLEIVRVQSPSRITENNSQGIVFAIISCQMVCVLCSLVFCSLPIRTLGSPRVGRAPATHHHPPGHFVENPILGTPCGIFREHFRSGLEDSWRGGGEVSANTQEELKGGAQIAFGHAHQAWRSCQCTLRGKLRSAKTDPVQFKRFGKGTLRDKFALLWDISLLKVLCLRGAKLLAKAPVLQEKGLCSEKNLLNWTGPVFPLRRSDEVKEMNAMKIIR